MQVLGYVLILMLGLMIVIPSFLLAGYCIIMMALGYVARLLERYDDMRKVIFHILGIGLLLVAFGAVLYVSGAYKIVGRMV